MLEFGNFEKEVLISLLENPINASCKSGVCSDTNNWHMQCNSWRVFLCISFLVDTLNRVELSNKTHPNTAQAFCTHNVFSPSLPSLHIVKSSIKDKDYYLPWVSPLPMWPTTNGILKYKKNSNMLYHSRKKEQLYANMSHKKLHESSIIQRYFFYTFSVGLFPVSTSLTNTEKKSKNTVIHLH